MAADPPVLWTPPQELIDACTLTKFADWVGLGFNDYEELWRWSVDDLEAFWSSVWRFFDVMSDAPPLRVLGSREMPGAEWFPGVNLSYAEHVFRGKDDRETAILFDGEGREAGEWTWADL